MELTSSISTTPPPETSSPIETFPHDTITITPTPTEPVFGDGLLRSERMITLGLSIFLLIGAIIWLLIWCKRKFQFGKTFRGKSTKDKQTSSVKRIPTSKSADPKDDLPQLPKTASLVSIQSTGSNYYDQLMGSGNIPKVKSISQYGALLAQQEPPPS